MVCKLRFPACFLLAVQHSVHCRDEWIVNLQCAGMTSSAIDEAVFFIDAELRMAELAVSVSFLDCVSGKSPPQFYYQQKERGRAKNVGTVSFPAGAAAFSLTNISTCLQTELERR